MKTKYNHILFDLDHTLWDFEKNSEEVLFELYDTFQFQRNKKFTRDDFALTFKDINANLWEKYNRNEVEKEYIRSQRFKLCLTRLGFAESEIPTDIGDIYLRLCPAKPHVIPFAFDILDYLKPKYGLHIITNGFDDVQGIKLANSKLAGYFEEIITSERTGYKKPNRDMFEKAIEIIGAEKSECIMIGDNLETDIGGALNASLDVIYFNPEEVPHSLDVTYEISCLSDLQKIL